MAQTTNWLDAAEKAYQAGDLPLALERCYRDAAVRPGFYWTEYLLAKIHERRGDLEMMEVHLRRAIRRDEPESIGASAMLMRHKLARRDVGDAGRIDHALALAERTEQRRWHRGDLLLQRALVEVEAGRYASAEQYAHSAFDFARALDETVYAFDWVKDALARAPETCETLLYLAARFRPRPRIDYESELDQLDGDVTVLEVGAMDGKRFDALYPRVSGRGWRAWLLEPTASMFAALRANYACYPNAVCLQLALSDRCGAATIYRVDPAVVGQNGVEDWALGLSSLDPQKNRYFADRQIAEEIELTTMAALAARIGADRFDVVQIDTEGHDYVVYGQIDLDRHRVRLLHIELVNLMPRERLLIFRDLDRRGFLWWYDGVDLTAKRA